MLNVISIVLGVVAIVFLLLGFIPLLGWTNWFLTLPAALVGLVLGALSRERGGLVLNGSVLALAALRLFLGGGVL
ncbi:hypothetical protein [Deinococcus yavapaiensis]|uniref:Uncharacterized protein n=1 Tax=Deinococcus yavapaiensis KR-236 TaxID=694435 RepID=A0A318SCM3_9DEIO|nr:hypothetical protein [Deinococcus yavapaiensis]PYE54558.1 hypothetical protein DES52_105196 [Deinococcus yavapaiensis KR-236]